MQLYFKIFQRLAVENGGLKIRYKISILNLTMPFFQVSFHPMTKSETIYSKLQFSTRCSKTQ